MPKQASGNFIAIIGDVVGSKKLTRPARAKLQLRFERLLEQLNHTYARELTVKLSITLGDEFQGVSRHAEIIPQLIWNIESGISNQQFRIGLGHGPLYTPISESTAKMDGPALHNARAAIMDAKKNSSLGGVFNGFGEFDVVLNGLARILWFQRAGWTEQQRSVIAHLRKGESQSAVANLMGISRQSISKHVLAAGWLPYSEAEIAWGTVLHLSTRSTSKRRAEGKT